MEKLKNKVNYNSHQGITLVILVITIIVLLILAGITINLALGDGGIVSKAKQAAEKYKQAEKNEIEMLAQFGNGINIENINNGTGIDTTAEIEELMNKMADLENKYNNLNEKYESMQNEMNEKDNRTLEKLETTGSYRS